MAAVVAWLDYDRGQGFPARFGSAPPAGPDRHRRVGIVAAPGYVVDAAARWSGGLLADVTRAVIK